MGYYNTNWPYRIPFTINKSMISGSHVNFPFRFYLTGNTHISTYAHTGGKDFIFTTDDGTTRVHCERDVFLNGSGSFWVRAPTLSENSDTIFYLYYGEGSDHSQDTNYKPSGVWDTSSQVVYHLNESGYPFNDSTANSYHILSGSATPPTSVNGSNASGCIGQWLSFDGLTTYLNVPDIVPTSKPYTIQVIATPNNLIQDGIIVAWGNTTVAEGTIIGFYPTADQIWVHNTNTMVGLTGVDTYCDSGVTQQWDATYETVHTLLLDGKSQTLSAVGTYYGNYVKMIGARFYSTLSRFWNGYIDEVRVSNVIRSTGWLKTSFSSNRYPSTYVTLGTLEEYSASDVGWSQAQGSGDLRFMGSGRVDIYKV